MLCFFEMLFSACVCNDSSITDLLTIAQEEKPEVKSKLYQLFAVQHCLLLKLLVAEY